MPIYLVILLRAIVYPGPLGLLLAAKKRAPGATLLFCPSGGIRCVLAHHDAAVSKGMAVVRISSAYSLLRVDRQDCNPNNKICFTTESVTVLGDFLSTIILEHCHDRHGAAAPRAVLP